MSSFKFLLVGAWIVFSISLASWWLVFGLRQLKRIESLDPLHGTELSNHQQMLMWEGGILILMLLGGGLALAYFVYQENRRYRQVSEFFATFSHELKTSLASLRIQVESLQEDLELDQNQQRKRLLDRLLKDSVRLELQLENSLFLADIEKQNIFLEQLKLSRIVDSIRPQWPNISIVLEKDFSVRCDRRAVESVLKNLIQNSVIHGGANTVVMKPFFDSGRIKILVEDDGSGFSGRLEKLGHMFVRHNSKSGSGVGLYLSKQLMRKMGGDIQFYAPQNRFQTELHFQSGDSI